MVRGGDGEPEGGQPCGLRDNLGFSGDRAVALIVRMHDNQHPNIQHRTSNAEHRTRDSAMPSRELEVECWKLNVGG